MKIKVRKRFSLKLHLIENPCAPKNWALAPSVCNDGGFYFLLN